MYIQAHTGRRRIFLALHLQVFTVLIVLILCSHTPVYALEGYGTESLHQPSPTPRVRSVPVPQETQKHFGLAMKYKQQARYELARQHLLLALATSNTTELRDKFQRELQIIDLQIRTLR